MKRSLIEIYALAVCFICVVSGAVSFGVGVYDLVQVSAPGMTLPGWEYSRHQSNDNFAAGRRMEEGGRPLPEDEGELTRLREQSYRIALEAHRRDAQQSLVVVAITLAIQGLLFALHWRIARRSRAAAAGSPS